MKLGMCLVSDGATQQGYGGPTQLLFYLVSKHICQSTKSQYKDKLSGDTGLVSFPVSTQRKQTVLCYKDDSVLCECTSEGPLQGDRECNTSFLQVFLSLIKWKNRRIIPLIKYDSLSCFYCCIYFSHQWNCIVIHTCVFLHVSHCVLAGKALVLITAHRYLHSFHSFNIKAVIMQ